MANTRGLRRADVLRLAAEAHVDPRTVTKAIEGKKIRGDVTASVRDAAMRLGIALPAVQTT